MAVQRAIRLPDPERLFLAFRTEYRRPFAEFDCGQHCAADRTRLPRFAVDLQIYGKMSLRTIHMAEIRDRGSALLNGFRQDSFRLFCDSPAFSFAQ